MPQLYSRLRAALPLPGSDVSFLVQEVGFTMADAEAPVTRAVLSSVLTAAFAGFERQVIAPEFRRIHERLDGLSGRVDDVFGHVDGLYKHIDSVPGGGPLAPVPPNAQTTRPRGRSTLAATPPLPRCLSPPRRPAPAGEAPVEPQLRRRRRRSWRRSAFASSMGWRIANQ